MTKNVFFVKKIKYSFQGHFFLKTFSIFPLYTREGGPAQRAPKGHAHKKIQKIVQILGPKSRVEKKMVPNLHFWAKCFSHFDDLQSNLFSRGPSALIFRDLSFLIWFNGICKRKSAFLHEKLQKKVTKKI